MQYAKQDRMAFIDAYNDNKSEKCVREAYKEIDDIKALQTKVFGGCTSQQEAMLQKMTPTDVKKLLNSGPNALANRARP